MYCNSTNNGGAHCEEMHFFRSKMSKIFNFSPIFNFFTQNIEKLKFLTL